MFYNFEAWFLTCKNDLPSLLWMDDDTRAAAFDKVKYCMSRNARKPVLGVSDQVQHKPACAAKEDG